MTSRMTRTLCSMLVTLTLVAPLSPSVAAAKTPAPPKTYVPAAYLVTSDGTRLWYRNPNKERKAASTIKMLNALVVRERIKDLDEVVKVSPKAAAIDNGDVELRAGQRVTARRLLDMMLVASANDAAAALAIHIGGSEKKYVALMNAKAKRLGLKHTVATDPHGLYKREHTSAADLAVLGKKVMADPYLRKVVRKRSVKVPRPGGGSQTYRSTNRLLGKYPGMNGVKTGFTNPAGWCLVASATRGKITLYSVVLGAHSVDDRFGETRKVLDWGFKNSRLRTLVSRETTVALTPAGTAPQPTVVARASKTVQRVMLLGCTPVKRRVVVAKPIVLPVKAGQQVAVMELRQGSTLLESVPLLATANVAAAVSSSTERTTTPDVLTVAY